MSSSLYEMVNEDKVFVKKECSTCKPTSSQEFEHQKINKCSESYGKMTKCMTQNKGNISSCKAEWSAFRVCFDEKKNQQKTLT